MLVIFLAKSRRKKTKEESTTRDTIFNKMVRALILQKKPINIPDPIWREIHLRNSGL